MWPCISPFPPHPELSSLTSLEMGLLFLRDTPPPQCVHDVAFCGWLPAAWGPSLSPTWGSLVSIWLFPEIGCASPPSKGRTFAAPCWPSPITHCPVFLRDGVGPGHLSLHPQRTLVPGSRLTHYLVSQQRLALPGTSACPQGQQFELKLPAGVGPGWGRVGVAASGCRRLEDYQPCLQIG